VALAADPACLASIAQNDEAKVHGRKLSGGVVWKSQEFIHGRAGAPKWRKNRFLTVLAPFPTVYRGLRRRGNGGSTGFLRAARRRRRLKTVETAKTAPQPKGTVIVPVSAVSAAALSPVVVGLYRSKAR
jgi:hypothetical protein